MTPPPSTASEPPPETKHWSLRHTETRTQNKTETKPTIHHTKNRNSRGQHKPPTKELRQTTSPKLRNRTRAKNIVHKQSTAEEKTPTN
ncbi:hypothetical protein P8452_52838 [Trifolium repens]|nr:hypothetical protein P8452_52838 [Trifolium repens]